MKRWLNLVRDIVNAVERFMDAKNNEHANDNRNKASDDGDR